MAVKKTTTTAKKATTTTTKKTTATAAKKTTTTAAKTTTAPKKTTTPAKPAANELSVAGNKKIDTLMKEFNKKFPYLRLRICYSYMRDAVKKGESITGIPGDKTLASVRRADSGGTISISGNKKIKSVEKEFDTVFGLYCKFAIQQQKGRGFTPQAPWKRKLLQLSTPSVRRMVAKKANGININTT